MKLLALITCIAGAIMPSFVAKADLKTWDGGAGTFSWHDAANWDPDGVPAPTDNVVISVPRQLITVTFSIGTGTINSVNCDEHLTITGGATLTINGLSSILRLTAGGGDLAGTGDITVTEAMSWGNSEISGTGRLIISQTATLDLGTGRALGRPMDNYGSVSWSFDNWSFFGGTAEFNNYGSLTMTNNNELSPLAIVANLGGGTFNNYGLIVKLGSATAGFTSCCGQGEVTFNNSGTVQVHDGTFAILKGSHTGFFVLASPTSRLVISGSQAVHFEPASQISGLGDLRVAGPTNGNPQVNVLADGTIDIGGDAEFNGGVSTFGGNFEVGGSVLAQSGLYTQLSFRGPSLHCPHVLLNANGIYTFDCLESLIDIFDYYVGELTGSGNVIVTTSMSWGHPTNGSTSTIMTGRGQTIVDEDATLLMPWMSAPNGGRSLKRILINNGKASLEVAIPTPQVVLTMLGGAFINNGTLVVTIPTNQMGQIQGQMSTAMFQNNGTLTKTGNGILEFQGGNASVPLENMGTVNVNSGRLWLNGGGVNSGAINTGVGTFLDFGAAMTHAPASSMSGPAKVTFLGGVHQIQGSYNCTGPLAVELGAVTINNSFTPGLVTVGRTLTINAEQTWSDVNIFSSNGILNGTGDITVTGSVNVHGTLAGSGTLVVASLATFRVNSVGIPRPSLERPLVNYGTVLWDAEFWDFISGSLVNYGTLNTGTFHPIQSIIGVSGSNVIKNYGLIHKIGASTSRIVTNGAVVPLDNYGTVDVAQGVFDIGSGGNGNGAFTVANGTTLRFSSDYLAGSVSIDGVLSVLAPAHLTVNGSLNQSPSGHLLMLFNSPGDPAVTCDGDIVVEGTLAARISPPPPPYTTIPLLRTTAGTLAGAFSSTIFAPAGSINYTPTQATWTTFRTGDVNGDNIVDINDLLAVINGWGTCPAVPGACAADVNGSGVINIDDLLLVITNWG